MKLLKELLHRNKILYYSGLVFLLLALVLGVYGFFNEVEVLGINSMIKPVKFGLSTGIYAWTMAYLLYYVNNQRAVKWYSILATVVMSYENGVITWQALRGQLSHFNREDLLSGILYALMGVMIVWLTFATLVIALRFIFQKNTTISSTFALSIKIGLILFVIFSFFGGYMSSVVNSHSVGGEMTGPGLPIVNWSTQIGDLRVAHFFGIHSLQLIPFFGYYMSRKDMDPAKAKRWIWIISILYSAFVCFTALQAFKGQPFIGL